MRPQLLRPISSKAGLRRISGVAAALTLASSLVAALPAYAYLEPGTATYVLQTLVAAFFGSLYAIKLNWHRIRTYVKSRFGRDTPAEPDE